METEVDLRQQIADLEARLPAVRLAQTVSRTAAFLDTPSTPVLETIGAGPDLAFQAVPFTLHRYEILRLCGSPLIYGRTPEPMDLALFLWFVSPQYTFAGSPAKRAHFARCRKLFFPPPKPILRTPLALIFWQWRCSAALANEAMLLKAARDYLAEAMADRPRSGGGAAIDGRPEYFCDACALIAALAREFGWTESDILHKPLKRTFQYLNEIKEHHAAKHGTVAVELFNAEDEIYDQILELMNQPQRN